MLVLVAPIVDLPAKRTSQHDVRDLTCGIEAS
jgi:hypothetical protein